MIAALTPSSLSLAEVSVSGCTNFGCDFFRFVLQLPALRTLRCNGCERFDALPVALAGGLVQLDLSGLKFLPSAEVARCVAASKRTLTHLCVNECDVDSTLIASLLADCTCTSCFGFNAEAPRAGSGSASCRAAAPCALPLQRLEMSWCERLDTADLVQLVKHTPRLEALEARCIELGDPLLHALAQNCHSLQVLVLDKCGALTDAGVDSLCSTCCALQRLDVGWSQGITAAAVATALRSLPHLRQLDLAGCKALTAEGLLSACSTPGSAAPSRALRGESSDVVAAATTAAVSNAGDEPVASAFQLTSMDLSWVNAASSELVAELQRLLPWCSIRDYYTEVAPARLICLTAP